MTNPSVIQTPINNVECHDCGDKLAVNAAVPMDDEDKMEVLKNEGEDPPEDVAEENNCVSKGGNVSRIGAKLAMWMKTAKIHVSLIGAKLAMWFKKLSRVCCCASHCTLESNVPSAKMFDLKSKSPDCCAEMVGVFDDSHLTLTEITERATSHELSLNIDNLTELISCTNLDHGLADDSH